MDSRTGKIDEAARQPTQGAFLPESVEERMIEEDGLVPNNAHIPARIYRRVLKDAGDAMPEMFEALHAGNGWSGFWHGAVACYTHFHSIAHELISVYRGSARIKLGGASGPVFLVTAGDVILIPAGVGHQNLGCTIDYQNLGCYPAERCRWDMRSPKAEERLEVRRNISQVPPPLLDPVTGGNYERFWDGRHRS